MNDDLPITRFSGKYYSFLSNFYPHRISYDGLTGSTLEHVFQALKTEDRQWRKRILEAPSAGVAKRLGRECPIRPEWYEIQVPLMKQLLLEKFKNPGLANMLLHTGERHLQEGNLWHDKFWGHCYCGDCGHGENMLGKLLMQVREEIK